MPRWQHDGLGHWSLQADFPAIYPLARVYKNHTGWVVIIYHEAAFGVRTEESKGGFATKEEAKSWASVMSLLNS